MSNYELFSLIFSGLALFVSIGWPVLSYFLLAPDLQAFRNRGRLRVQDSYEPFSITVDADSENPLPRSVSKRKWIILIKNIGSLPAKNVEVLFSNFDAGEELPVSALTVHKHMVEGTSNPQPNEALLNLKPIAPGGIVRIVTEIEPDVASVLNEFGELTFLRSSKSTKSIDRQAGRDHLVK